MRAPDVTFFNLLSFSRRGSDGMPPFHEFFGLEYSSSYRYIFIYWLLLMIVVLALYINRRLVQMPVGRAWGSPTRRRDSLSLLRIKPCSCQAFRLYDRCQCRRSCWRILRRLSKICQSPLFYFFRIRPHSSHSGIRRFGVHRWSRHSSHSPDSTTGTAERVCRLSRPYVRRLHDSDDDMAAAWPSKTSSSFLSPKQ